MDREQCLAVYIDERVPQECWITRESLVLPKDYLGESSPFTLHDHCRELASNAELILDICKQVYLCNSGKSFASKLAELREESNDTCALIFAFVDIAIKGDSELIHRRSTAQNCAQPSPSPPILNRSLTFSAESEELYGFHLLSRFSSDIQAQDEPNIIVPIAILRYIEERCDGIDVEPVLQDTEELSGSASGDLRNAPEIHMKQLRRCLDAGAVDVLTCPFENSRVKGLVLHAYRTQKAAQKHRARFLASRKVRRQSWVGTDGQQSYAYLREAMVSKLMKRICNPEEVIEDFQVGDVPIVQDRKSLIERGVANWDFLSHDFSDDELIHVACVMVEHALKIPELEQWRISTEELRSFLLSVRAAYNSFVLYHNFRHAIDVLQSVFHFLVRVGALPPFPSESEDMTTGSGMASILTPFDALTLLITAIGHDVGHPGVNNVFLVKLNAPLAQLYNDKSVLEAFHCAAYSQILRRHWPSVFTDIRLRKLMIDSILATDMGVHNMFMESLEKLQQNYCSNNRTTWGWKSKDVENYRGLLCAMLIKCADISNVARPFHIAERWTDILQREFANQGIMEAEIGMETALFGGPPELGNLIKKANGQIGFMDIFALPLFDGVTDVLPDMAFAANEIRRNKLIWQKLIDRQKLPGVLESSITKISPNESLENRPVAKDDSKPGDYDLSSVYYTIPCENLPERSGSPSPGASQVDRDPDDKSVTNAEHYSQEPSTPKNDLPPLLMSDNMNKTNNHDNNKQSLAHTKSTSPLWAKSQPDSGNYRLQRAFKASPVSAVFNHSGQSTNGVRNQSASTYTNNTVISTVSCSTQASSLITTDSNSQDEKDCGNQTFGEFTRSGVRSSYESSLGDGACEATDYRRPSTADIPVDCSRHRHQCNHERNNRPTLRRSPSFMSSLLDKGLTSNHRNLFTIKAPSPSIGHSNPANHQYLSSNQQPLSDPNFTTTNGSSAPTERTIPRRRSRLRLAFWRRNKQPIPPLPSEQHR
ncbi:3',5'-cyclic-nucleotide phosphodiesterase [Emydomyces testavorans]|uniref:Phosphodiesterase n=1 Tax=Emydomyces testavorans TaxID=2070801 RepID=A0AAF0DIB8_9EURO|nr:3',5'-cyclic-nucleotide phosphodiesterase [Emydomyces testavorans]